LAKLNLNKDHEYICIHDYDSVENQLGNEENENAED
jgi:hypothetical protein